MNLVAAFIFLTPWGGLIALAVALPLTAAVVAASRRARARSSLTLQPPARRPTLELASLVAVPLLLAIAAAGPAIRSAVGRGVRTSTEAIFVVDVSRSMAAAAGPHAPTRLDKAKTAALELRDAIPSVKAGISSLTTELLPHLFPSTDEGAFAETLDGALGVLKPPPPAFQIIATTFDPLGALGSQGFFNPTTRHRVAVLLTDGESTTFYPNVVGQELKGARIPGGFLGGFGARRSRGQAPVKLLIVRFGSTNDRIYLPDGSVDPGYRPDLRAGAILTNLATEASGRAFDARHLAGAKAALMAAVGSGPNASKTITTKTTRLAPYFAFAALIPLAFFVWRRNFADL